MHGVGWLRGLLCAGHLGADMSWERFAARGGAWADALEPLSISFDKGACGYAQPASIRSAEVSTAL